MLSDYLWIVIAGGVSSFISAMGIGANDVANAFASSIGSKALNVKKAIVIAGIFECAGAILMGSHVTKTIRKGIADYECFEDDPEIFIYGCFCVLVSVGAWLFLASYLEMPVSTTHSCVGGMIGMTIVTGGPECVLWYKSTDNFPWVGGVLGIVISWFLSPIFSGIVSGIIFYSTRALVLRRENSFDKSYWSIPIFVSMTIMLNTFFIIYKGGKGIGLDDLSAVNSVLIALMAGTFSGGIIIPFIPKMKGRINDIFLRADEDIVPVTPFVLQQEVKEKNIFNRSIKSIKDNNNYDINYMSNFIKKVNSRKFRSIMLPKFDKAIDDRFTKKNWY